MPEARFSMQSSQLKRNPTIYWEIQSRRIVSHPLLLFGVFSLSRLWGKTKGRSFSTYFAGSGHTFEAEEVTNFFRKKNMRSSSTFLKENGNGLVIL